MEAKATEKSGASKRGYLDQKWKLNSEDAKDFKGFPKKGDDPNKANAVKSENVPVFALMYKLRKEYFDAPIDSVLADHRGHCAKFKRLLNTEIIRLPKARGVVLLWAGFSDKDQEETKAEITKFMEDEPFIVKDYVENWDLIDLGKEVEPGTEVSRTVGRAASAQAGGAK